MGVCCSRDKADESVLIDGHPNATTEAIIKSNSVVPPAPLLKEINFAAINDEYDDDANAPPLNSDDVRSLLENEEEEITEDEDDN